MTDRFPFARPLLVAVALIVGVTLAVLAGAPAAAQEQPADPEARPVEPAAPTSRDNARLDLKDLEGTWVARDYLERLRNLRAPHATARQATGVAITIAQDGRTWSILTTDFQTSIRNAIVAVQPDARPGSYRLVLAKEGRSGSSSTEPPYLAFRGRRDANGAFQTLVIAEPNFARKRFLTYLRLDEPLDRFVNRAVLAGTYRDAEGQTYEFTEEGEAILPDRTFQYEVSLDPNRAQCELIISHREREPAGRERIGFRWKGASLQLFEVTGGKAPYKCRSAPFAVLTRQ